MSPVVVLIYNHEHILLFCWVELNIGQTLFGENEQAGPYAGVLLAVVAACFA